VWKSFAVMMVLMTPIFKMLTARDIKIDMLSVFAHLADDYLVKPF